MENGLQQLTPPVANPLDRWLKALLTAVVPLAVLALLYFGFDFLRTNELPKVWNALAAVVWGVGGIWLLFLTMNWVVLRLPGKLSRTLNPFVFVAPALLLLFWYLALPVLRTLVQSFQVGRAGTFGLENWIFAFTNSAMLTSFRNNLVWLLVGTFFSVALGLLIAMLADRCSYEKLAKSIVFLPMAISFVGAGIIWRFIYYFKPAGEEQIGLLNAIVTMLGGDPVAWLTKQPWNTLLLVVIMVWLQTGYATVLISAAIKGVPNELLEAARIDGGSELQIFFRIIIPVIKSTLMTVTTTIIIATLKIFDIVFVMTNGNYGTEVIASMQYKQMFKFQDFGRGSAIAIVLLILIIPVMIYNLRQFREKEAFS